MVNVYSRLYNECIHRLTFYVPVNEFSVIKADAIKFIMIFRSVLPSELVIGSLPHMVRHLAASSTVVHSYAACAIEKILTLKGTDGALL